MDRLTRYIHIGILYWYNHTMKHLLLTSESTNSELAKQSTTIIDEYKKGERFLARELR